MIGLLYSHVIEHSNCDSPVSASNPGCSVLSGNNLGQVVHTHSPSRSRCLSDGAPGSNHTAAGAAHCDSHCDCGHGHELLYSSCSALYPLWVNKMHRPISFELSNNKTDGDMDVDGSCLMVNSAQSVGSHSPDELDGTLMLCYGTLQIVLVLLLSSSSS